MERSSLRCSQLLGQSLRLEVRTGCSAHSFVCRNDEGEVKVGIVGFSVPTRGSTTKVDFQEYFRQGMPGAAISVRYSLSIQNPIVVVLYEVDERQTITVIEFRQNRRRTFATSVGFEVRWGICDRLS